MFAVGNDHAGTYLPVVVPAVAFLGEILASDRPWVRVATLDVLLDLLGSFEPDPASCGPNGAAALRNALFEAAQSLLPTLDTLTVSNGDREAQLVEELRALLSEGPSRSGPTGRCS